MTKETNQNFTSDKEGSLDSKFESHEKKSNSSLFGNSRPPKSGDETHSTPETDFKQLKERILVLYQNFTTGQENSYFFNKFKYYRGENISKQFWMQMYSALEIYYDPFDNPAKMILDDEFKYLSWVIGEAADVSYDEFGDAFLSSTCKAIEEAVYFYLNSDKNEFCNFIEFSLKLEVIKVFYIEKGNQLVEVFNEIFGLHNHEFELSPFVYDYEDWDYEYRSPIILEFPRVISKSEPLYKEAIEPALSVLRASGFRRANSEFIGALRDYRNEDFSDCLTKCGSALESVLIILSDKFDIKYSQKEPPVVDRIKLIVKHLKLDDSLTPVLKATAVLRNKLSSAHGRGEDVVNPSPHVAQYAINCTASAILLLVKESNG